ncbi:epsin-3 isoform X2 [Microcaecilia unicolor]|uniref:Epsin-3 isoform X2 n=1 Tax=Microcaecilia unicolor TaxID=1415580 RepID=A0A6P7Y9R6_9AMPH|nr:epsin-3 isoform X2 [Microcaecilia unicolor]
MTTSSLRRQVKNIVHNYSEAEIKVREATSNDPWGPSSSLMSEIAELTLNAVAFSEVMGMIWRRLNDSGKNWRHVYKALTLLDYLIKTGSEKVAHQCRENMFTIQTLKDFQFLDRDGKDQGINVREKAKQIVALLKDEERLKQERSHARKTKERMALGTSSSSSSSSYARRPSHYGDDYTKSRGSPSSYNSTSSSSPQLSTDLEQARPQTSGEEELQLQLALAMSREEAEKEVRSWQGENSLLQKALNENLSVAEEEEMENQMKKNESSILDLVDIFGPAPVPSSQSSSDPWDIPGAGSGGGNAAHIWNNDNISSAPNMPLSTSWEPIKLKSNVTESAASWNCSLDPWGPSPDPWTAGPALSNQASGDPLSQPVTPGKHASAESWDLPALPSTDPWGKMSSSPKPLRAEYADPWGEATEKSSETDDATLDIFAKLPDQPEHVGSSGSQHPSSLKSESPVDLDLFGDPVPSTKQDDTFDLSGLGDSLSAANDKTRCRTPESFLDPAASSLVNLDSLISNPNQGISSRNPFLSGLSAPSPTNPFQLGDQTKPTLNQMRTSSPVPCAVTGTTLNQIQTQTPGLGAVMGTGLNQLRTISPVPGLAMGTSLNQMRTISPVPGIAMETNMNSMTYSTSLPLPLSSISSTMGVPSSMSAFPQRQGVPFDQLPSSLPQPLLPVSSSVPPSSSQAGSNPFL